MEENSLTYIVKLSSVFVIALVAGLIFEGLFDSKVVFWVVMVAALLFYGREFRLDKDGW